VGSQAISEVTAPTEGRQKTTTGAENMTKDLRETHWNRQESQNSYRVTTEKQTGGMANRRETSEGGWKRSDAGVYIKPSPITR
jgi:hypothetical protein